MGIEIIHNQGIFKGNRESSGYCYQGFGSVKRRLLPFVLPYLLFIIYNFTDGYQPK